MGHTVVWFDNGSLFLAVDHLQYTFTSEVGS